MLCSTKWPKNSQDFLRREDALTPSLPSFYNIQFNQKTAKKVLTLSRSIISTPTEKIYFNCSFKIHKKFKNFEAIKSWLK